MAKKDDYEIASTKQPGALATVDPTPAANVPALTVPSDPSEYPAPEELPLPRISILQQMSDAVVVGGHKAGKFLDSQTGEEFDTLEGILLCMSRSRVRFVKKESVCRANDFKNGVGDPGGVCAKCIMKDWGDDSLPMEQKKPKCQESGDFIFLDKKGQPFLFDVKKTGLVSAWEFLAGVRRQGLALFCVYAKITLHLTTNDLGTFYVPHFEQAGQTDPATWEDLAALAKRLLAARKRQSIDALKDDSETPAKEQAAAEY